MKKILMLVAAFVIGNGMFDILPTLSAQEVSTPGNPQDSTALALTENMALVASAKADSTLLNYYLEAIKTAYRHNNNQGASSTQTDSLDVATENVDTTNVDKPFDGKVVKWGGRDRYGRFTDQCAAHVNGRLARAGYYSQGHAYQIPSYFPSVINGYLKVEVPDLSKVSAQQRFYTVLNMHREAADYVKKHLDISKLVPGKYYLVNMYYRTSPYMLQFFYAAKQQGTRNYGTHVGVLYYSTEYEMWIVEHNIHGHVHYDPLESILGGVSNPHNYGVTSISRVSK